MNRAERRQEAIQSIKDTAEKMQGRLGFHIDRTLRRQFARSAKHRRNLLKRMVSTGGGIIIYLQNF